MVTSSSYTVQPITPADEPFLWEMLYQALYAPEGSAPFPRDVVRHPAISRYVQGWGRPDDSGFLAVEGNREQPVGATWIRLLTGDNKGYGYVDDATPELSIAVMPEHRGRGVGTSLLLHLLSAVKGRYPAISLSVSADNPALRLYQRLGFAVVKTSGTSLTMRKALGI